MPLSDQEWKHAYEFAQLKAKFFGAKNELVEDMAGTAMEKLVKQEPKPDNIEAWLTTVVKHQMMDLGKKVKNRGGLSIKYEDMNMLASEVSALIQRSHGSAIVNEIVNQEKVKKILEDLEPRDQELLMWHFAGKDNKDIALEMEYASAKVVATRIAQLIKKLQKLNPIDF
jgi:RNA polymerase sigma factor (sigma-70 family)